jgi:hypothetical protein
MKLRWLRVPLARVAGFWSIGLLFAISTSAALWAQPSEITPCHLENSHPGWLVYSSRKLHFCLKYPPTYHLEAVPPRDQFSNGFRSLPYLVLNRLPPGTTGTMTHNQALINFVYRPRQFSIKELQALAPTGIDQPPTPMRYGRAIFYFYGAGGGGVEYPDEFFVDLRGKILIIGFFGPYKGGSKSPTKETQDLEKKILPTFRSYR